MLATQKTVLSLLYTIWCKSFLYTCCDLNKTVFIFFFWKKGFTLLTNKRFGVVQHFFYFWSQTRRLGFPIYNSKQHSCHSFHFCIDCIFLFVIFNSYIYMYIQCTCIFVCTIPPRNKVFNNFLLSTYTGSFCL